MFFFCISSTRLESAFTERGTSHAMEKQEGINALIEKLEDVMVDHDKLERNNLALQDYIGGLHRSMSRTALDTGRKK